MIDLGFVLLAAAFYLVAVGYVVACQRLYGGTR